MAIRIQNAKHIKPEKCLPKSNIIKSLCIYVYNTKKIFKAEKSIELHINANSWKQQKNSKEKC